MRVGPVRAPLFEREELPQILLRHIQQGVRLLKLPLGAQGSDLAGGLGGDTRLRGADCLAIAQALGLDLIVLRLTDAAAVSARAVAAASSAA